MCVCIYGQFKCTELADSSCFSSSSLLNAVQPLHWTSLRSKHAWAEGGQVSFSVQAKWDQKHQYTLQKSECRDTIVSEVCVPVPQSGQFVLAFLATKSPTEIKGFCPCLEREGQNSAHDWLATAHFTQLRLFLKRIKTVQTPNNVRVCFNLPGRLFQLFVAGHLKKQSLPSIVSGAPDTWTWIAWFKQRADW